MKRKSNNRQRRFIKYTDALLKQYHVAVYYSYADNALSSLVDTKTGRLLRPHQSLISAIVDVPHRWAITMSAVCDSGSERYVKHQELIVHDACKQAELADYLEEMHSTLLKEQNAKHLKNATWIASPFGDTYDPEFLHNLYEKLGAWPEESPNV